MNKIMFELHICRHDSLQIWRVIATIQNKQSLRADKGWKRRDVN